MFVTTDTKHTSTHVHEPNILENKTAEFQHQTQAFFTSMTTSQHGSDEHRVLANMGTQDVNRRALLWDVLCAKTPCSSGDSRGTAPTTPKVPLQK